jgi:hypothetical protein
MNFLLVREVLKNLILLLKDFSPQWLMNAFTLICRHDIYHMLKKYKYKFYNLKHQAWMYMWQLLGVGSNIFHLQSWIVWFNAKILKKNIELFGPLGYDQQNTFLSWFPIFSNMKKNSLEIIICGTTYKNNLSFIWK